MEDVSCISVFFFSQFMRYVYCFVFVYSAFILIYFISVSFSHYYFGLVLETHI